MSRDVDALLRGQDWGSVSARILAFALKRTGSKARASDLAQEAMMRALDPRWNPWDPEKDPDIVTFLIKIVNRLLTNENQKRKRRPTIAIEEEAAPEGTHRGDDEWVGAATPAVENRPGPEATAGDRQLYRRRLARLRERLAGDRVALDVIAQTELGVELPDEQASATGHSLHAIHTARRRCAFHAEKVARELSAHGEATASRGADA